MNTPYIQCLSCGTLFGSWRSVTVDNFFTSAVLAKELFKKEQQKEAQCTSTMRDPTGIFSALQEGRVFEHFFFIF
jgi:hypothetical protein